MAPSFSIQFCFVHVILKFCVVYIFIRGKNNWEFIANFFFFSFVNLTKCHLMNQLLLCSIHKQNNILFASPYLLFCIFPFFVLSLSRCHHVANVVRGCILCNRLDHMYQHWMCQPCQKPFGTKHALKRHHLHNCPFSVEKAPLLICTELDCPYTTRRRDALKTHVERHF